MLSGLSLVPRRQPGRRCGPGSSEESPWWVPEPIDDRIFSKIFNGVQHFLADVAANPQHEVRIAIDARIRSFAERLREDPVMLAKGEEVKHELLAHRDVQAWLQSLWGELKQAMLDAAADPQSELRRRLTTGLAQAGERIVDDPELQAKFDGWVERVAGYVVENYRGEAAALIATTVERWDSADTSRRIELQVGRDLQFIRINGTVVGGLAGLVIHAISVNCSDHRCVPRPHRIRLRSSAARSLALSWRPCRPSSVASTRWTPRRRDLARLAISVLDLTDLGDEHRRRRRRRAVRPRDRRRGRGCVRLAGVTSPSVSSGCRAPTSRSPPSSTSRPATSRSRTSST